MAELDKTTRQRLDGLLTLLERLEVLHQELCESVERRLSALRQSDLVELQQCTEHEGALVTRIEEQEGLRRQLMERLGRSFGLAPQTARSLSAREFAQRLHSPYRERIISVADEIKGAVESVKRRNQIVQQVSQRVLEHLNGVLNSVRQPDKTSGAYSAMGRSMLTKDLELFEAVG